MTTATAKKAKRGGAFTVPASDLASALRAVAPAVSAKSPVLSHVLLGGYVEATNGDLRITVALRSASDDVLVPHARLSAIIGSVHGDVEIECATTSVTIRAARGTWVLPTADVAEWPRETINPKPFARLPADQFVRSVSAVIDAADSESSRFALGGVLLEHRGPDLAFVATDGRRLQLTTLDLDQATDDASVIVPRQAMQVLGRIAAAGGEDPMQLGVVGSDLVGECGAVRVTARLLSGRFPRWLDVVPAHCRPEFGVDGERIYKEPPEHAEIVAGELLAAVRQAAIVTSEQSRGVTFAFTPSGLGLQAQSSESGQSMVTADLAKVGPNVVVRLDPQFVTEWLRTVDAGAIVEVFAQDSESAVVLRHEDALAVLMPMAAE